MSNQSKGRKISRFIQQNSIPSTANLTYISGGVNYQISLADFLSSIGVTGTIVQQGNVLGTPVLDKAGSVNGIRNIEDGSGIRSSVSAEDGITLEHNFTQDTAGVGVVSGLTDAQPKFRSIVGGAGVNVSASNGTIQVALSSIPVSTKTIIVNSLSDFPTPVGGVITLDDNTEYAIRNDISTANRFVLGNNCVLSGSDSAVVSITYTGVGVMFTSVNCSWKLKNVTVNAATGTLIDFDGTGVEIFQALDSEIVASTLGTFANFGGIYFDDAQIAVTTNGFAFAGTNGVILIEAQLATIAAGIMWDLGTATFAGFSATDCFVTLNGTSKYLSGLASSGNIDVGGLGAVHNCRFYGTGTPLQTITANDIRWQFFINDDIEETHKDCLLSQVANLTATVITVATTPVPLAGTWTQQHAAQFTGSAAGRMTYNGIKETHFNMTCSFSAEPTGGTNKDISFYIAKNGTPIAASKATATISAGSPTRITVLWRTSMAQGDYIETHVANDTDTIDVLVNSGVQRIS